MKSFLLILSLILLTSLSALVTPPIWPDIFSQSFVIQFNDSTSTVTTGKFWYDSTVPAQRFDFLDGKTKFACGVIYSEPTSCSLLTTNHTLYIILPEKNLCCNGGPSEIVDKNWLQNYTYLGQTPIDGEEFYEWTELVTQESPKYFADKSSERTPRRWSFKRTIVMDYLKSSYNRNPIQKSVFAVPSYCNKQCSQIIKENSQQSKTQAQQKIRGIKRWTGNFQKRVYQLKNLLREQ